MTPAHETGWYALRDASFSGGNEVTLLTGGDELFPAMQAAIARSHHEVWLATYIFHDDAAARSVAAALIRAARRGVRGPVVGPVAQTARAMWTRAAFGRDWRDEVIALAKSAEPVARARTLIQRLRIGTEAATAEPVATPVRAAFLVRDNLRQRRAIERSYIDALSRARTRIDLMSSYFYPGRLFRRVLRDAARRGVRVRLLLQGKLDYRFAGLAASVLYDELLSRGVQIFEYTPAYLHAKVALADDDWATVGSSNIDPLSLLLNLEANIVVRDVAFTAALSVAFEEAVQLSREVTAPPAAPGWLAALRRGFVAWAANWYLRLAGITGRY